MLQLPDVVHQRYQLQQKLGQNASRQTWLAMDLSAQPSQPVILKLLAFNPQMQWEDLKLFEREAQVLQQLQHPWFAGLKQGMFTETIDSTKTATRLIGFQETNHSR